MAAAFKAVGAYPSENRYKYWVNRDNGWIAKAVYDTKSGDYQSITMQLSKPVPDLELPMPE